LVIIGLYSVLREPEVPLTLPPQPPVAQSKPSQEPVRPIQSIPSSTVDEGNGRYVVTLNTREKYTTSIKVPPRAIVNITVIRGSVRYDMTRPEVGASGSSEWAGGLPRPSDFPIQNLGAGALVFEVGGEKYPIGKEPPTYLTSFSSQRGGLLMIYINDRWYAYDDNIGRFMVAVEVVK
jgi:hypothetical protein